MREANTPTPSLPDDPAALRALLLAAWAERDSLSAERNALAERIERKRPFWARLPRTGLNVLGLAGAEGFRTTLWRALATTRRVSATAASRF
jgi:hypothetical protein